MTLNTSPVHNQKGTPIKIDNFQHEIIDCF